MVSLNILEEQVTDLTQLADSPLDIPSRIDMNGHQLPSASAPSATSVSPAAIRDASTPSHGAQKRKSDEIQAQPPTPGPQARAKRNRYIAIACNECKRRKIKCNGNTPCQRCGNLNLECRYAPNCCAGNFKDTDDFRRMNAQIAMLQEKVDTLYANLNALRTSGEPSPSYARDQSISQHSTTSQSPAVPQRPVSKHPRFQGPTSAGFSLDVAKNTLHSMGYSSITESADEGLANDDTPLASPPIQQRPFSTNSHREPILALSKDEVIRLCRVYEEEMGLMYPVVNIEKLIIHATNLYKYLDAAFRNGLGPRPDVSQGGISDDQSNLLKMVVACAMTVEGSGQSDIGGRLFDSVKGAADRIMHAEGVEIKQLPLLPLVAMYHFHCDEETLAWRIIGVAARMCMELGLHRSESFFKTMTDDEERSSATKLFWSIYVLDRRWSFGTGMPFAIQDADIDPALPEPGNDLPVPYLNVMIAYSRLGCKVWKYVSGFDHLPSEMKKDEVGYLDYQIIQWQQSIPPELQLPTANSPQTSSRAIHRLQVLLYLRCNQMRILIHRPVLHSANSIMENLRYAATVVELAKDTIRALSHLNQTTDIYRVQQVCFNYFLISSLTVIFLAICHAPVQFSTLCREEFYMALDLVKGFSSKSFVSKRLWRAIKSLKEVGPKLGLSRSEGSNAGNSEMEDDPHNSAALAMAGLAGHDISGLPPTFAEPSGMADSPVNGFQISHEMTNLFEAALIGGANGVNNGQPNGLSFALQDGGPGDGTIPGANGFGEEELYRQLKELF